MSELPHTGKPEDAVVDSALSGLYREAGREIPPSRLDRAILAAARRGVSERPRLFRRDLVLVWRLPLSLAAVVVLSVTLVMLMTERHSDETMETLPLAPPPATGVAPEAAVSAAPARPAVEDGDVPLSPRDDHRRASTAPETKEVAAAVVAGKRTARPSTRDESAPPVAQTRPAAGAARTARREAEKKEEMAAPQAASRLETRSQAEDTASAAPVPAPPDTPTANVVPKETVRPSAVAPRAAAAPVSGLQTQAQEIHDLPPEQWLAKIESLRREGKAAEAKRSLAEFRRRYPDYPLPPSLR